ncbi:flagellar hook-length control protein FliK [Natroniella sp. ANB-PHB2]|uniref:flagellar hook-length control protein FliK n=1 Tax=Natroniella sp. ANB-PHB2 TaxID=3384444 RepID=UPI0038D36A14
MTKIKKTSTLKQYNSNYSKKSNLIDKKTTKKPMKNLTISEIINKLSLEKSNENKTIIQELLRLNLPLKQDLIADLNQSLAQFEKLEDQDLTTKIKTILLLKELELPINNKFYSLFKDQANLTNNLKDSFIKLLKKFNPTDSNSNLLEESNEREIEKLNLKSITKEKLLSKMNNLNLELTEKNLNTFEDIPTKEKSTKQLLKSIIFTEKLDLNSTNRLTDLIKQIDWSPNDNLVTGFEKLINLLVAGQKNVGFPDIISPYLKKIIKEKPELLIILKENLTQELYNNLKEDSNLSSTEEIDILTKQTKELLKETVITTDNLNSNKISTAINNIHLNNDQTTNLLKFLFHFTQSSSEKVTEAEKLLKQLTSLQAINHSNDNFSIFLPILFQNDLTLAHIKVNKEATKEDKQDPNNTNNPLTFSIHFETEKLGLIETTIKIKDKKIWGQFRSNQTETVNLINKHLDKFKSKLKNTNYTVKSLTSKLATDKSAPTQQLKLTTIDLII